MVQFNIGGVVDTQIAIPFYFRWKTHKWRKCQLVPWFLRQNSAGAQETCGPGLQTRGKKPIPSFPIPPFYLHWSIPNLRKLHFCSSWCTWSRATGQQTDVWRFREKATLRKARIKFSLCNTTGSSLKTPARDFFPFFFRLFFFYFLFSSRVWEGNTSQRASWDSFDSLRCFTAGIFSPQALVMQF